MRATEKELSSLHGMLAKTMQDALAKNDRASILAEKYTDELPAEVLQFLLSLSATNPALLTACAKFLKDNEVTVQIDESPELSALEQRLLSKRKRIEDITPVESEYIN